MMWCVRCVVMCCGRPFRVNGLSGVIPVIRGTTLRRLRRLPKVDPLLPLIQRVALLSGVTLRGPLRGREVFGRYEAQAMSRKTVSVEALNLHGEWEIWVSGSELEVRRTLEAVVRLLEVGKVGR